MSVYFDDRQTEIEITDEILESLEKGINVILEKEAIEIPVEVSISFVENQEIRETVMV